MKVKIYQIDMQRDKNGVKFTGYDELPKRQKSQSIDASLYAEVFSGEVDRESLEGVYEAFNCEPQPLSRGHSLSVSDVVVTERGAFYCDRVGFKKIDFDEEKAQKPQNLLRVVYVEPEKPACVARIENTLNALQRAVGGRIQSVTIDDDTCLICNDEGVQGGAKLNRRVGRNIIAGSFFIVGVEGDEFRSLTDEESKRYLEKFSEPENFEQGEVMVDTGVKFVP